MVGSEPLGGPRHCLPASSQNQSLHISPRATQPLEDPVLFPWLSSQMSLSWETPKGISASLPSHIPPCRNLGGLPQSYLASRPQTRGAVSVLAATGPRRGSPILLLGPGHTSWGSGRYPGCGGRVVRRHLWLQRPVWGSQVGGPQLGGNSRKSMDSCPSGVAECNVNPRARTVIFLFLVTRECTERSDREEREKEAGQRAIQREGHTGRDVRVAGRERGGVESHRHQENERNKTKGKPEVML